MTKITKAYATPAADKKLQLDTIQRREPGEKDVVLDILFCGVCHSDIHTARNEWGGTIYPCVPGHEIVGRVAKVGSKVTRFKKGDKAAVGCLVDSCRKCSSCREDLEQHCEAVPIFTYNSPEKQTGWVTYGGYSENIVVDEDFVLRIPSNLDLAPSAPLLCAGITTYSPLKRFNVKKGQKVGIVGLGGLGHMAVKFANAFGAHVVVFSRSKSKIEDAKKLGAHEVVISTDELSMKKQKNTFDLILDTVSSKHDIDTYLNLLKRSGSMVLVGVPQEPISFGAFSLIFQRHQLAGSLIGGIKETQEMLDFCGKKNIVCDIELINIDQINEAYERILKSDVKYRFVIDMGSLKS
ncbi:MAG: hydroxyacid dehydrogenase [Omnitrophica WOR_2 bacterium GWF2_38_59]|nr:MAG: hydroxyacid dehydrogenase [Omnitrophica WOR_2 bacterium GWA2_37_7]OGX25763.1 MAG: hydroxyacid dehydrogenase [Omnitrophica WOR_2 bacterium GWF2_38_59]OGX48347.1 MAG: hydroxyacid dehydrogenase [Omnitrophica WOR_2 bacterium RIFOXYA2_FULL_38_17]OGX54752.1 MAG: hydroxyacid dehydrogenase [Omnitrophica WOR_2 bacterium RIFOXYA12_FULL_38_10]OGX55088.1 MAG: hydroxyacid dehydrogenase [Omnitrophica WOR_2 bacterium RIFOXYC2_FULL_38_12]OGX58076.1 MAG: hydroxyacid dehydrogenase [Omnitrophica WOR_2 ba